MRGEAGTYVERDFLGRKNSRCTSSPSGLLLLRIRRDRAKKSPVTHSHNVSLNIPNPGSSSDLPSHVTDWHFWSAGHVSDVIEESREGRCHLDSITPREGFPGGSDCKGFCLQCRRPRFDPWVRKIPWRREWQPTPVFFPGEFHGQRSLVG